MFIISGCAFNLKFFFIYLRYPTLSPPQYPYTFSNLLGSLLLIISEKFLVGFILNRKTNKIKDSIMRLILKNFFNFIKLFLVQDDLPILVQVGQLKKLGLNIHL